MTPIQVFQLLIFAAYAFGQRPTMWLVTWVAFSLVLQVALMVWRAMAQVRAAEEAQRVKASKRSRADG